MGRKRIYATRAEQMRAYRQRLSSARPVPDDAQALPQRPTPRPARLQLLIGAVQTLHTEYLAWLDRLPETLVESPTGLKLADAVEQLEAAADLLAAVDPPRGYGRD